MTEAANGGHIFRNRVDSIKFGGHLPPHVTILYFLYPIGLVSLISLHGIPMTRCQDHHKLKIALLYQIIETLDK